MRIWQVKTVPGLVVVGIVCLVRLTGILQFWEWEAFDYLLRLRPDEGRDERVVIVGINEADIQSVKTYPIPDREIARLIQKLQTYQPKVIGLDIVRSLPVEPGHNELVEVFKLKNLITIAKVLPEKIPPPPISREQVGFSDAIADADGYLRRSLLGTPTDEGYKFSFALQLAKYYLATQNISLENGIRDRQAMRFGHTEIPRFLPNFGGYVGADAGGVQVLVNYRNGRERFRKLSLQQIKAGKFNPDWLRDRIILIGITSPGVDLINSAVAANFNPGAGKVYGVEFQAHAVSQIISAVRDRRPLLNAWSDGWEYLWILAWGLLGMTLSRLRQSPIKNALNLGLSIVILFGISYSLLILGWWVPIVPALLVLGLNGIGLAAFYQYDRALKSRIAERQLIIDSMFDTIHNGSLQTLARILRRVRDEDLPPNQLITELEKLNRELRAVYESASKDAVSEAENLYLADGKEINLQAPLHEILYTVYRQTLERDFPCFQNLKVKIRTFEPIDEQNLSVEQKRSICRFLEEALCNVGKHAVGVTRLSATCTQKDGWCTICVTDNGAGIAGTTEGRGTQQSQNLAKQLQGQFERSPLSPRGTKCELTWRVGK